MRMGRQNGETNAQHGSRDGNEYYSDAAEMTQNSRTFPGFWIKRVEFPDFQGPGA